MRDETQEQAEKRHREWNARTEYTDLKSTLLTEISKAKRRIATWQKGVPGQDAHSTQIRDYGVSLDKLIDHVLRMKP